MMPLHPVFLSKIQASRLLPPDGATLRIVAPSIAAVSSTACE
jgi:hypothetical protein